MSGVPLAFFPVVIDNEVMTEWIGLPVLIHVLGHG